MVYCFCTFLILIVYYCIFCSFRLVNYWWRTPSWHYSLTAWSPELLPSRPGQLCLALKLLYFNQKCLLISILGMGLWHPINMLDSFIQFMSQLISCSEEIYIFCIWIGKIAWIENMGLPWLAHRCLKKDILFSSRCIAFPTTVFQLRPIPAPMSQPAYKYRPALCRVGAFTYVLMQSDTESPPTSPNTHTTLLLSTVNPWRTVATRCSLKLIPLFYL